MNKTSLPDNFFFDPSDPRTFDKLKDIYNTNAIGNAHKIMSDVYAEIEAINPKLAHKLAFAMAFLAVERDALKMALQAERAKSAGAVKAQKAKSSKLIERNKQNYADYLAMPKKTGWAHVLGRRYNLTSKRIENIVSEIKNGKAK